MHTSEQETASEQDAASYPSMRELGAFSPPGNVDRADDDGSYGSDGERERTSSNGDEVGALRP